MVCGTGSNDTRHSVAADACGGRVGAHAVLVVTPYYNKPNRAGLRAHFEAVAEAAGETPVDPLQHPLAGGDQRAARADGRAGAEIDNVVGVKQANDDELGAIDGLDVLAGNDGIFLRCLEVGGAGGILVGSHLVGPEMRALYDAATSGAATGRARSTRAAADLRRRCRDRRTRSR